MLRVSILVSSVVNAGRPTVFRGDVVSRVESSISIHRCRQITLSAAIRIAAAAAGGTGGWSGSRDGRGLGKSHHRWYGCGRVGAFVAGFNLAHVSHPGGYQRVDTYHDEHETHEQNNVLDKPVDERNDCKSHWRSTTQRIVVLVVELVVEVVYVDGGLKDDIEREKYHPRQHVVS